MKKHDWFVRMELVVTEMIRRPCRRYLDSFQFRRNSDEMISQDHVFGTSDASQPSQERRNLERFPDRIDVVQFLDAVFKKGRERKTHIEYLLPSRRRTIATSASNPQRRSIFRSSSKSYKRTSPPAGLSRSIRSIRWLPLGVPEAPSSNVILCV